MTPILETHGLTRRFGAKLAARDVTLQVPPGSIFALLGPNGAGKTTTIKVLMNILEASGGSARVLGQDSRRLGPAEFRRIGYVSENQEHLDWMTVAQMLDYYRPFYPTWDEPFARRLLAGFDLPRDQRIKNLSRGMKMKAALLSSLAYHPQLLVLDEPFTGLDALVRDEFSRGVLELTEQEAWTVFLSSHDIDEVERLADWVAVMNAGTVVLCEPVADLQARFRLLEAVTEEGAVLPAERPSSWVTVARAGRRVRIVESRFREDESQAEVRRWMQPCEGVTAAPMSLREIFVVLAGSFRIDEAAWSQPKEGAR